MTKVALAVAVFLSLSASAQQLPAPVVGPDEQRSARWLKGNTHTHTLRSDGDSEPADVIRWYREHGYDFLVITDHDMITDAADDKVLLIPGEEVTDRLPQRPLHTCAIGLRKPVKPQGGATAVEVLQNDVDAIRAAGGLAAINHPNFGWALTAGELARVDNFSFLEIASGHPLVNMDGGGGVPSAEAMWDTLLTAGKRVFAIAVDDSHHYKCLADEKKEARPGRGWVVVKAPLASEPILRALAAGDFYASTGVELDDVVRGGGSLAVAMKPSKTFRYRTLFIGAGGVVLGETASNPAVYYVRGDETYVRAKVIRSDGSTAWTQPMFVVTAGARSARPSPQ